MPPEGDLAVRFFTYQWTDVRRCCQEKNTTSTLVLCHCLKTVFGGEFVVKFPFNMPHNSALMSQSLEIPTLFFTKCHCFQNSHKRILVTESLFMKQTPQLICACKLSWLIPIKLVKWNFPLYQKKTPASSFAAFNQAGDPHENTSLFQEKLLCLSSSPHFPERDLFEWPNNGGRGIQSQLKTIKFGSL